jgi:glycerol-3-phosphate dehydrogenase (NAD(P)+)
MATVLILGAGMMGTALAQPLADRGHEVRLVGTFKDRELIAGMRATRVHAKLQTRISDRVQLFDDDELPEALRGSDVVALGVSSAGIDWATGVLAPLYDRPWPLFMITKGLLLEDGALRTLPDVVSARLPTAVRARVHPAAIAGPCIAGELARGAITCVVLAGRDDGQNRMLADLLRGPYYHVLPTTDVVGAEVCAALKNAFAMGIAFAEGMHQRRLREATEAPSATHGKEIGSLALHNLESALLAQATLEMRHLCRALGSPGDLAVGLAGVGDLDVTTNGGRTGKFGRFLGEGLSVAQATDRMAGATLECLEILGVVDAAFSAGPDGGSAFGGVPRADCPFLAHLCDVALRDAPVALPLERFFDSRISGA